jgi:hypothetical protein
MESQILTATDIFKYCRRASGRTTRIIQTLKYKLMSNNDCKYAVIVTHLRVKAMYLQWFTEFINTKQLTNCKVHYVYDAIENIELNNRIEIFTDGDVYLLDKLKGKEFNEMYFDTPELDVINPHILDIISNVRIGNIEYER